LNKKDNSNFNHNLVDPILMTLSMNAHNALIHLIEITRQVECCNIDNKISFNGQIQIEYAENYFIESYHKLFETISTRRPLQGYMIRLTTPRRWSL
jgi:hypothetical protein